MSLISLLLALSTTAGSLVLLVSARRLERSATGLRVAVQRARVEHTERARFIGSREAVAEGSDLASAVVTVPTAVVRFSHEAIAAIPFTVLENIPATAETSKVVREIHDEISHVVYDVIEGTTRGIAGMIRRGLSTPAPQGRQRPRPTPSPRSEPPAQPPNPTPR